VATLVLWLVSGGLLYGARALFFRLEVEPPRWIRPYGIFAGSCAGTGAGLLVATLLAPFLGLQPGTFHNLAILAICLGFLGLCTGSLAGLLYAGMTLSEQSRTEDQLADELWLREQSRALARAEGARPEFDSTPQRATTSPQPRGEAPDLDDEET
jgi:hypothetical protein